MSKISYMESQTSKKSHLRLIINFSLPKDFSWNESNTFTEAITLQLFSVFFLVVRYQPHLVND